MWPEEWKTIIEHIIQFRVHSIEHKQAYTWYNYSSIYSSSAYFSLVTICYNSCNAMYNA